MTLIFVILLVAAAFCALMMSLIDRKRNIIPDVYLFPFFDNRPVGRIFFSLVF